MRSIYCILLLSWPIIACAETGDSLIYRHGFLIEFDNATINQVGYRYRLTDVSRLAVRLHFGYEKYRNDNAAINNSELYSYEGTVGFERDIYKSGSATLFLSIGIKYMGSHSTDVTWTQAPEAQTITGKGAAIGCLVGVGVEYFVTKQLSIFSHQDVQWIHSRYSNNPIIIGSHSGLTSVEIVKTQIGLTYYL